MDFRNTTLNNLKKLKIQKLVLFRKMYFCSRIIKRDLFWWIVYLADFCRYTWDEGTGDAGEGLADEGEVKLGVVGQAVWQVGEGTEEAKKST